MANDPFAPKSDPWAGSTGTDTDPFGQPASGGGKYPKAPDLNGALLLLTPIKVDVVPDKFNAGKTTERLSADTVVLDGSDGYDDQEFDAMYWSQGPVVTAGQKALRQGTKMILGRLRRYPTKDTKAAHNIETWSEMEALLDSWDYRKNPKAPGFAWALDQFTPEDAEIARRWLATHTPSPF